MKELRRLLTLALFVVILCTCCTWSFAQGRLLCYTTWDEFYLFVAFQVDDSNVVGKNSNPNSNPWQDDCVEFFVETDNQHAANRTPATYSMAVSPAGGSGFTTGVNGKSKPTPIVTYKYAQTVQGSLNDADDTDIGYQVEMALPWSVLGIVPRPGTMMSFNVVCRLKGEQSKFISLSQNVKTEADIQNPSKWGDMVLGAPTFGAATLNLQKILCSPTYLNAPQSMVR